MIVFVSGIMNWWVGVCSFFNKLVIVSICGNGSNS